MYCAYAILIELLIVVVILGILAAVIIPNVSSFVKRGQVAAANAELAQVGVGGQAVAGSAVGGVITAYVVTPAVPGVEMAKYLQGKLKGTYAINTDGSVQITGAALAAGPATAGLPSYPTLYFSPTSAQFQATATLPQGDGVGPGP